MSKNRIARTAEAGEDAILDGYLGELRSLVTAIRVGLHSTVADGVPPPIRASWKELTLLLEEDIAERTCTTVSCTRAGIYQTETGLLCQSCSELLAHEPEDDGTAAAARFYREAARDDRDREAYFDALARESA